MIISSAYLFARQIKAGDIPSPIPDYWINDAGVDHCHDITIPTSATSRPYIDDPYFGRSSTITTEISGVPSDSDCGVTGAKEISVFRQDNALRIPLYNSNEEESEYNIRFTWKENSQSTQENWKPQVELQLFKNDTSIWTPTSAVGTFDASEIRKVYIYAGVDSFSEWMYGSVSVCDWVLFAGIAVVYEHAGVISVKHLGACYNIYQFESSVTENSHLGSDWYTRST